MAQKPKPHVREAILRAAIGAFAEVGYERATLAAIAERAGTSIGNVYKYFSSKEELFEAALPASFVRELSSLLERRVKALGRERDAAALAPSHPHRIVSEELLCFALAHRPQVLFLLARAQGSPYATFRDEIVQRLVELAVAYVRNAYLGVGVDAKRRRGLARIYRSFIGSLVSVLAEESSEQAAREAIFDVETYHLAGLGALFTHARWSEGGFGRTSHAEANRPSKQRPRRARRVESGEEPGRGKFRPSTKSRQKE